ncbi:hypothetical protein ES288_D04G007800v1 [Gossypium darwinii]|uniref:Pentacotripeptide-repeat region of PRORP domain-containing protein n=1 Tax=Gossypium darwinii TaxID=34276 RepID=A0A5D2CRU6_GOSDA|nr:hypothetical protein ES288_D04G007800v1 [Gossypium darwinii]
MKLPSLFVRPITHFSSKTSKSHSLSFTPSFSLQDFSVSNEIHSILRTVNPMEPALEPLLPFLSPDIVTSIIKDQPNPQLGFRFFIWATQRERLRSSASEKLVLDMLLRKDNAFDMFWQTLEEVKKCGVVIVPNIFKILISGYSKMGLEEKAVECFGKMKYFDCKPDLFTFNAIIYVMISKKVLLLALAVYNQMLKSNYKPNRATFSILLNGLCKNGKTEDALKMFDEMTLRGIEPNRCIYTIIISGLCRADRADDACRLLGRMKDSGCSPDFVAYNALLNGFCELGRLDEAFALLQSFQKDGFVLGLRGYSSFINSLFKARRYEEAHEWYTKMFEENVEPDVVLYAIMLQGLSKAGKVDNAMKLLTEMTERGMDWLGRLSKFLMRWKSLDVIPQFIHLILLFMDFLRPVSLTKQTFCFTKWK